MVIKWIRISLFNLLLVGLLGCLLRWIIFAPIEGLNFRNFLHAHSHLAFLGWVFNALFIAFIVAYIPEKVKNYRILFWLLQVAVIGMLISFPIQGYAALSIFVSTLHIILSYWFTWKFFKDTSHIRFDKENIISIHFIRLSLIFMVLSSLGPFALGAIMAKGLAGTSLYQLAIYFYLHFQYDGWFSFGVFGLFFWLLEKNKIRFKMNYAKPFLWLMALACVPVYALSTLWTKPDSWVYVTGFLAATLQIIALFYLILLIKDLKIQLRSVFQNWSLILMKFALCALVIKIWLQFASAFPFIADFAFKVRNFTVGYLHIVFIGFVSVFMIALIGKLKYIDLEMRRIKVGLFLFLTGFIFSEAVVFLQPLSIMMDWGIFHYAPQLLFFISLLMPIGTALILIYNKNENKIIADNLYLNKHKEKTNNHIFKNEGVKSVR